MKLNKTIAVVFVTAFLATSGYFAAGQTTKNALTKAPQSKSNQWQIEADKVSSIGEQGSRILNYEGNVDAQLGDYRIKADKLTINEADKKVVAEGSVVFSKKEQSISGRSLEFYYKTDVKKIIISF